MSPARTGNLRIYLGAAAGSGKTYAMLGDARVAIEDGVDVVIGYLEPHGRARTEQQAQGMERAPVRDAAGRRAQVEVDVEWLVGRQPIVALVDELAHTNEPGSSRGKRHEDVEALLAAGIDVWTTVNIQHLESLADRIEQLVGLEVRETFPDRVLHAAAEIRLIDIAPESLRERIAAGFVYGPDRIEAALAGFFTVRNLTALRALALHEMAENAAAQLRELDGTTDARPNERILVAVGGHPDSTERLVRAGSRIARRSEGELYVLYVEDPGRAGSRAQRAEIEAAERLTRSLDGVFLVRANVDVAAEIASEARAQAITQIVLGATQRSRPKAIFSPGPIDSLMRDTHGIDLHIVAHPPSSDAPRPGGD